MTFSEPLPDDCTFMALGSEEVDIGYDEGGVPDGSVIVANGNLLARGHNRPVQEVDPIAHG